MNLLGRSGLLAALAMSGHLFGAWAPPPSDLTKLIVMDGFKGPDKIRPIFLSPLDLQYYCQRHKDGMVNYLAVEGHPEGFTLTCLLPIGQKLQSGRTAVYFRFEFVRQVGSKYIGLLDFSFKEKESPREDVYPDNARVAMMKLIRDQLMNDKDIEIEVEEGQDAFAPSFRYCKNSDDSNCTPRR
jgi:hypothetical protein